MLRQAKLLRPLCRIRPVPCYQARHFALKSESSCAIKTSDPRNSILSPPRYFSSSSSIPRNISRSDVITSSPDNNVPDIIYDKIHRELHRVPNHPIEIIKRAIHNFFTTSYPGKFTTFDDLKPIVSTRSNFDEVLIPRDHVSRSPRETYYVDSSTVLRCHTSAHQSELLRSGNTAFLVTGDVYRRDCIDRTHFPIFHQMEGVRIFTESEMEGHDATEFVVSDLKKTLEGLVRFLFETPGGEELQLRWVDAYFPFTEPSLELEIWYNNDWMEVLGCGVMQQQILEDSMTAESARGCRGWAFGLGLERLAMRLFAIPDIRLFWSTDPRFMKQFQSGQAHGIKFQPFSSMPACYKDVSFWIPEGFCENAFFEMVRGVAGDLVEEVILIDPFTHPKTGAVSHCYRILYRSMDRTLTNEAVNDIQKKVISGVEDMGGIVR